MLTMTLRPAVRNDEGKVVLDEHGDVKREEHTYVQQHIEASVLRRLLQIQAEASETSEAMMFEKMVQFVASCFDGGVVTAEMIWRGFTSSEIADEIADAVTQIMGGEKKVQNQKAMKNI
ncbi:hypothetical protein NSQ26_13930 [Bacillus sp. FSL W7-1360]